ncbi:MAG: hypothetical protein EOP82_29830 [Variovorax sp.]|nr:MAG: hypothetical protein EOP82_29830 [Variovorax sp.]
MNAKQLLAISGLAFAGAVGAQTVPAEQWVGAPISTAGGSASRVAVMADFQQSARMAQAPQEFRVGPADASTGAVSRAEVAADRNLWIRSGLSQATYGDNFDPTSASYRAKLATYQRMRHGPEFTAEVQRVKSPGAAVMTSASMAPARNAE